MRSLALEDEDAALARMHGNVEAHLAREFAPRPKRPPR